MTTAVVREASRRFVPRWAMSSFGHEGPYLARSPLPDLQLWPLLSVSDSKSVKIARELNAPIAVIAGRVVDALRSLKVGAEGYTVNRLYQAPTLTIWPVVVLCADRTNTVGAGCRPGPPRRESASGLRVHPRYGILCGMEREGEAGFGG
ncbi:MAG: hypothetical protein AVDCRST_MAG93-5095, partial [uncultured Chloroflexia bacterium]